MPPDYNQGFIKSTLAAKKGFLIACHDTESVYQGASGNDRVTLGFRVRDMQGNRSERHCGVERNNPMLISQQQSADPVSEKLRLNWVEPRTFCR